MTAAESRLGIALLSLIGAPVVGLCAMAVTWAVVTTDGQGQMDLGVILIGAAAAAAVVALFARSQRLRARLAVPWLVVAFLVTSAIAFGVVWLFYSLDFSTMD